MATIYKICERASWLAAESDGQFLGTDADERDGFIHFSTAAQLAETAAKHFAQRTDLVLLAVDAEALGLSLVWERSRGGEFFPHLYAPLPLAAVLWSRPLPDAVDGRRAMPELPALIGVFERLARPFLHALDPEDAHSLTIKMLTCAPLPCATRDDKRLAVRAFGLNFPNPIGMAAGFDKNAEVPDALLRLGFGFVEAGTVTPLPQRGNPRPRVFRLKADRGVINRLGFNSQGAEAVLRRLAARANAGGIVGINIGANKDTADRVADYVWLIERFAPVASYVTINVSSPNTPGLRNLQQAGALDDLLARVIDARERVTRQAGPTPLLLKIAPDLSLAQLDDVVGIARSRQVDGMIVGNTTLTRPASLHEMKIAKEAGGLSGRPLLPLANSDAGRDPRASGGCVCVDRCRRHRFRRRRARQNACRREPHSALFRAGVLRPWPYCRDQGGAHRRA